MPCGLQSSRRDAEYSLWAKDLVFVISDGYLDGMQAFITTYHGLPQASRSTSFQSMKYALTSDQICMRNHLSCPLE